MLIAYILMLFRQSVCLCVLSANYLMLFDTALVFVFQIHLASSYFLLNYILCVLATSLLLYLDRHDIVEYGDLMTFFDYLKLAVHINCNTIMVQKIIQSLFE